MRVERGRISGARGRARASRPTCGPLTPPSSIPITVAKPTPITASTIAGVNSTPILDRRRSLPPESVPSGLNEHGSQTYGLLVGIFLIAIGVVAGDRVLDSIRQWFSSTLPGWPLGMRLAAIMVAAVAGCLAAVAVHELGHVLAGLSVGFRFVSVRVGRLQVTRPFRWSWSRSITRGAAGMAHLLPVGTDRLGARAFGFLVGGPAANWAAAGIIMALPFDTGLFLGAFVCWSVVVGTVNLVPFGAGTFVSDGRRLVMLLRHPAEAHRWLAMLALISELDDGVPPESLSPDFMAAAIAIRDDSFDTVAAHLLAYSTRFYQHDDAGAAEALEVCLGRAEHFPAAIRETLMCEAAIFQGRRRMRVDLAEAWLEDIPTATVNPGLRQLAEAAVLEARGDRTGARQMLEAVEVLHQRRPDMPGRNAGLRSLRRWKVDLEQAQQAPLVRDSPG